MVIRGHVIGVAAYAVWDAVVGYIYHCKQIRAADRFVNNGLCLTGTETRAFAVKKIGIYIVAAVV